MTDPSAELWLTPVHNYAENDQKSADKSTNTQTNIPQNFAANVNSASRKNWKGADSSLTLYGFFSPSPFCPSVVYRDRRAPHSG